MTINQPFVSIQKDSILFSFETSEKLYDLVMLKSGEIKYAINCKEVKEFPKTSGTKRLFDLFYKCEPESKSYLSNPTNENWWTLKNAAK